MTSNHCGGSQSGWSFTTIFQMGRRLVIVLLQHLKLLRTSLSWQKLYSLPRETLPLAKITSNISPRSCAHAAGYQETRRICVTVWNLSVDALSSTTVSSRQDIQSLLTWTSPGMIFMTVSPKFSQH